MNKLIAYLKDRLKGAAFLFTRIRLKNFLKFSVKDLAFTIFIFAITTGFSFLFSKHASDPTLNIAMLYTLGVFIVSRYTAGYLPSFILIAGAVLSVNFFFTYPYKDFNFSLSGYQMTFAGMIVIGLITSLTSTMMKEQSESLLEKEKTLAVQEKKLLEADKEKMRANLLRAVSHDLRTPLTGIIGNSDSYLLMEDNMTKEDKDALVNNIKTDANWLLNMVENLLSVTRIDAEHTSVSTSLEVVEEVIQAAIIQFKKRFPNAELNVSVPNEILMCRMDPMLIEQVIINILQNAYVHSHTEKPIELFVTESQKDVNFHIKDYGIGIDKDKISTIFDGVGYRSDVAATDGYKGMGIGLSICKTIVLAHGGEISCFNHENGAEFVFSLPKED